MIVPKTILNPADMEQSRTPRELYNWVDAITTKLSKTKAGKNYARSGSRLPKKLWEEIRPLALFSLYLYGENDVLCTPNLTNDNYDGKIEFLDTSIPPVYIEITYAKDGKDERHRLQILTEKGNVSALGKITVSRTKGSKTIKVENEGLPHIEVLERALDLVKDRLIGKSYIQYGKDHILVVVIDDYLPFRTEEDKEVLMIYTQTILTELTLNVGAIYLLGSSGNYCIQVI